MQTLTIEFYDDYAPLYTKYYQAFKSILKKTMLTLDMNIDNYLVEVSIVDEDEIKNINNEFRHVDAVTDVLSFPFDDDTLLYDENDEPFIHLGSILICAPRAILQSKEYAHDEEREFSFLFVHGLLHLLGYDHETKEEEAEMFALQDKIIGKRGEQDDKTRIN